LRALNGVRVIEIAGLGPGPFCGMLLAGMGAAVTKIERAGAGGFMAPGGVFDRDKQTVTLDLKQPSDVDQLLALVDGADAFIDVFRPGVAERLGIGPDVCLARNPRLVYGRLTGYGQSGPLAAKAGHDINYLAIAGALEPLGRADGPPTPPINVLADFAGGGLLLAYGICAALYARDHTGAGCVIDSAMIDGAALLMAPFYSGRASGGWGPRGTNVLDGGAHFYNVYECADGKWLAVGSIEPQFYAALLHGLALTDEDPAEQWNVARWPEQKQRLAVAIKQRTRDEWTAVFADLDACVTPVLDPVEATRYPHNAARHMFDGVQPRSAPRFDGASTLWPLDPTVTFLNHGSFGSCPRPVLELQTRLRAELEAEPITFLLRDLETKLDGARARVASFVGADCNDVVFVTNATSAVNAVLRSLTFAPGDELLVTNHAYNACANAVHYVADRAGARVVVAEVPFPLSASEQVLDAVLGAVTERTTFALLDHVTSATAIIFPIEALIDALVARGVTVMIDGAHAPGMLPLDISALQRRGLAFYTGNLHKWVCAPKGAAFLWVERDRQPEIRPLTISHGANDPRTDRSRYLIEFDWQGTDDPTAWLCVPEALDVVGDLHPHGWPGVMAANHELALHARDILIGALGVAAPAPDDMIGSLVTIPLPRRDDELHDWLWKQHRVDMPVMWWDGPASPALRVSCQLYNRIEQYEQVANLLATRYR